MEVLCENASGSQQCREEPAKGFVSLPGLKVKETHPGAWEGRWQEPGQEDRGGAGRGQGRQLKGSSSPGLFPSSFSNIGKPWASFEQSLLS